MPEIVPLVGFEVNWHLPRQSQITMGKINSDAAGTRLKDAIDAAIHQALSSTDGVASVTITVRRVAKGPTEIRIVACGN